MRKRSASKSALRRDRRDLKSGSLPERAPFRTALCLGLIVAAGLIAYANSFSGAFVYDDYPHIVGNEQIRKLSLVSALHSRRPLVSLSLSINYHFGELKTGGYHAVNLIVHLLAAFTLFGVMRRTLRLGRLKNTWGSGADWLALAVALLWTVHPLQTESVTYVIQRAESMMGLFYLLTLYCVIRSAGSTRSGLWTIAAVVACVFGMLSKAVMVSAPLVILLYDRTFLSASFAAALRKRWPLYLALCASLLVLVPIGVVGGVLNPHPAGPASVGFGYKGITPLEYLATQPSVILHYLRMVFWPQGQCLDYDWQVARATSQVFVPAAVMVLMVVATLIALWRQWWAGMIGAWFLLILAPTSSFIPIRNAAFEHRMYLPLAAVITGAVAGFYWLLLHLPRRKTTGGMGRPAIGVVLLLTATIALCIATIRRNRAYRSAAIMWTDVVGKRPENFGAFISLGAALREERKLDQAIGAYQSALKIRPTSPLAYAGLGLALVDKQQFEAAMAPLRKGLELGSGEVQVRSGLAYCLVRTNRLDQAVEQYQRVLDLEANNIDARFNLALLMGNAGRFDEAEKQFRALLRIDPAHVGARFKLAGLLVLRHDLKGAVAEFRQCLRLEPRHFRAQYQLGLALQSMGRLDEAMAAFRKALAIRPDDAAAREALANLAKRRGVHVPR